jgi:small-conductance mechanosensitive channel
MNSNVSSQLSNTISDSLSQLSSIFITFLPQLFWALLVLIIGFIIAHWAKSLTLKALQAVNLNPLLKKFGLETSAKDDQVFSRFESSVGEIVRWFIIYLFLISVFNILGITSIAQFMQNLLGYLPNIITALFIFIVSVLLAGFAESFVKSAFTSFDIVTSRLMGKIASYTVVVVGSLIALSELGIAEYFINILFVGFVITLSLTIGLSFGLGSKDLITQILTDWYKKYTKKNHSDQSSK